MGSGSSGNATLVATDRVRLLVDVGFSFREVGKRLRAIGEDAEKIDAILISHEHADHVSGLPQWVKKAKAPIYITESTEAALGWNGGEPNIERFRAGQRLFIGDLEVDTFTVPHDAVDPIAFCFCSQGVKAGLVMDLGYIPDSVKHHVDGCHLLLLESNHDLEMLRVSPYPFFVRQRVGSRNGHLSNQAVSEFLQTGFDGQARWLVLTHLSEKNNHPAIAEMSARDALNRCGASDTRLVLAEQRRPTEVFRL